MQGCFPLKPAGFGSDACFVYPGRSAKPQCAFNPPGASPGTATWALGSAQGCKNDGDRLHSRASWHRTRGDGFTLKKKVGQNFFGDEIDETLI